MKNQLMINQPLIQTLGYRSDLKILIRVKNWGKEPQKPFKFSYSTSGGAQTYAVHFDGTEAYAPRMEDGLVVRIPATMCDVGVRLCIEGPYFEPGKLCVERRFFEDKKHFDADNHDTVQHVTTSIQLVDKDNQIIGDDCVDEVESPRGETTFEQAKRQGYQGSEEQYAQELMHLASKADQIAWPTTTQGLVAIKGEKWPDATGKMRQVYAATFSGKLPNTAGGFIVSPLPIFQVQLIDFYIACTDGATDWYLHAPGSGLTLNWCTYKPGATSKGLLAAAGQPPEWYGKSYFMLTKCTMYNE